MGKTINQAQLLPDDVKHRKGSTMTAPKNTAEIRTALAAADRTPGWNMRADTVRRFTVGTCTLYVVPFRCWAYRRQEKQGQAWRQAHGIG